MKSIKTFFLGLIEVIRDTKKLQAEEFKKRHFQK